MGKYFNAFKAKFIIILKRVRINSTQLTLFLDSYKKTATKYSLEFNECTEFKQCVRRIYILQLSKRLTLENIRMLDTGCKIRDKEIQRIPYYTYQPIKIEL